MYLFYSFYYFLKLLFEMDIQITTKLLLLKSCKKFKNKYREEKQFSFC